MRSRGAFAYVLAASVDYPEAEPLCRLRHTGMDDTWEFAYNSFSSERFEVSCLPSGLPFGTPEECFDCAAGLYLAS